LKQFLATAFLVLVGYSATSIESWLERRGLDRWSMAFLALFALGVTALLVTLFLHFGRHV
jgi:hypothetical protein